MSLNKTQTNIIDNFIYKGRVNDLNKDCSIILATSFRNDSMDVEINFFSFVEVHTEYLQKRKIRTYDEFSVQKHSQYSWLRVQQV